MSGQKDDSGKLQWHLIPIGPLKWVVKGFMHGAKKYGPHNWKLVVSESPERYYDAAQRHLSAVLEGEVFDRDSNIPHLALAICSLIMLLWAQDKGYKMGDHT